MLSILLKIPIIPWNVLLLPWKHDFKYKHVLVFIHFPNNFRSDKERLTSYMDSQGLRLVAPLWAHKYHLLEPGWQREQQEELEKNNQESYMCFTFMCHEIHFRNETHQNQLGSKCRASDGGWRPCRPTRKCATLRCPSRRRSRGGRSEVLLLPKCTHFPLPR